MGLDGFFSFFTKDKEVAFNQSQCNERHSKLSKQRAETSEACLAAEERYSNQHKVDVADIEQKERAETSEIREETAKQQKNIDKLAGEEAAEHSSLIEEKGKRNQQALDQSSGRIQEAHSKEMTSYDKDDAKLEKTLIDTQDKLENARQETQKRSIEGRQATEDYRMERVAEQEKVKDEHAVQQYEQRSKNLETQLQLKKEFAEKIEDNANLSEKQQKLLHETKIAAMKCINNLQNVAMRADIINRLNESLEEMKLLKFPFQEAADQCSFHISKDAKLVKKTTYKIAIEDFCNLRSRINDLKMHMMNIYTIISNIEDKGEKKLREDEAGKINSMLTETGPCITPILGLLKNQAKNWRDEQVTQFNELMMNIAVSIDGVKLATSGDVLINRQLNPNLKPICSD